MHLPANRFPNKPVPNVPDNILKNSPFRSFVSFLIVSLTPFVNKPDYLRDLTVFIRSFMPPLEMINVV